MKMYIILGDEYADFTYNKVDSVHLDKEDAEKKYGELMLYSEYDAIRMFEIDFHSSFEFDDLDIEKHKLISENTIER